jgi:hypothetical protein
MLELKNGELAARPLLVLLPLLIIEELVNAITGVARIAIDNAVENFMFSFYYWRQQLLIDRIEVGDNVRERKKEAMKSINCFDSTNTGGE